MTREFTEYPFKTEPRGHQLAAWRESKDRDYYALLFEYGAGKTKTTIDTAAYMYDRGKIDGLLVIAPKSVYRNWTEIEIPKHMPDHVRYQMAWHDAAGSRADKERLAKLLAETTDDLKIVAINIESLTTEAGENAARSFLLGRRCMMVVDEATIIKNIKAERTKVCLSLGNLAPKRWILCGDPYANSPLDVYAMTAFLSPDALGFSSFYAFRARFAKLQNVSLPIGGGRFKNFKKIVGFKDLEDLKRMMKRFSFTVKKEDCLDLPPKIMMPPRYFEMGVKQKRAYEDMRKRAMVELGRQMDLSFDPDLGSGSNEEASDALSFSQLAAARSVVQEELARDPIKLSTADVVLTQLLRLQQIACGFLVTDDGEEIDLFDGEVNPRVAALLEMIDEITGKIIIWAPFRRSIDQIQAALTKRFGKDSLVRFDGTITKSSDLETAKTRFQDPRDPARFFLTSQSKGARGITLTQASAVIYYDNLYDNELRANSEDRPHRVGLDHPVTYQDLRASGTVNDKVADALAAKRTISELLRDGSWKDLFKS